MLKLVKNSCDWDSAASLPCPKVVLQIEAANSTEQTFETEETFKCRLRYGTGGWEGGAEVQRKKKVFGIPWANPKPWSCLEL